MTTEFRIVVNTYAEVAEPDEPPIAAWPTTDASPIVRHPAPTRQDGYGHPAGVVGLPYCEFGRNKISAAGVLYYTNMFLVPPGSGLTYEMYEHVWVKAKLFDPRSGTWKIYQGVLWQPVLAGSASGAYNFRDFRATISELSELSAWSDEVDPA